MRKLLSVLITLLVIMAFVSCDNSTAENIRPSNAGQIEDDNTILIKSIEEYVAFVNDVNSGNIDTDGKLVKLTTDIDFEKTEEEFVPFDVFAGTFDGDGYSISYTYSSDEPGDSFGLFKTLNNDVTIKNLTLVVNINIVAAEGNSISVGAVVGKNTALYLNITDVFVSGNIEVSGNGAVGGILGTNGNTEDDFGKASYSLNISGSSVVDISASEGMNKGKVAGELFWTRLDIKNYTEDMVGYQIGTEIPDQE